jgi:hypothetical protein
MRLSFKIIHPLNLTNIGGQNYCSFQRIHVGINSGYCSFIFKELDELFFSFPTLYGHSGIVRSIVSPGMWNWC